jgi:C-terminal processing protease CtpA/Prc
VIAAAKLWAAVKVFHPALTSRDIDWDKAWLDAYPRILAASDVRDYGRELNAMLAILNDPLTTIAQSKPEAISHGGHVTSVLDANSILTITIPDSYDFNGQKDELTRLSDAVAKSRGVIFDLRDVSEGAVWVFPNALPASGLEARFIQKPATAPCRRFRLHAGLPSIQKGAIFYYSGFEIKDGPTFPAAPGAKAIPVVFLVRDKSPIPLLAPALQIAGNGWIVSEGPLTDWIFADTITLSLPDRLKASVRVSELLYPDNTTGLIADAVALPGQGLTTARKLLAAPRTRRTSERVHAPASGASREEAEYAEVAYPSEPLRTLAAIRIWSNYNYYSPHKDLLGESWDGVLERFLPKLAAARNAREYHLAVAEMVTHVHDSHAAVESAVLTEYLGAKAPKVLVNWIEHRAVITRVESQAVAAGLRPGDAILSINGEDTARRVEMLSRHISASTDGALMRDVCVLLLAGDQDSEVEVQLQRPDGAVYKARLVRNASPTWFWTAGERTGDIVRLVSNDIGYVDLDRLKEPDVSGMFDRLRNTRAIIFDMRGYPSGTMLALAAGLCAAPSPIAAVMRQPIVVAPERGSPEDSSRVEIVNQRIPNCSAPRYSGKTVMLIDQEAQSEAEHVGLWLEAANGTKFVGSPSAGADGPVTEYSVPGGIRIRMTGVDIRHADGRPLQRVGLQPDIRVAPTIAGVAAGTDEVLERAIAFVRDGK